MSRLLLLLLISLGFTGSAYAAGDVYSCKYSTVRIMGDSVTTGIISPDITLIVDKKQVTTIFISPISGKSLRFVYKILEQDKRFGLTALEKPISNSVSTLYFDKVTKRFSMADLTTNMSDGSSGRCTFMYSQ